MLNSINFLQVDYLLTIDAFFHNYGRYMPRFLTNWKHTGSEIEIFVHHKFNAWKKFLHRLAGSRCDLYVHANELCPMYQVSG